SFRVKRVPVSVSASGSTNPGVGGPRTRGGAPAPAFDEPCMPALNGDRTGLKDALFQPSAGPAVPGAEPAGAGTSASGGDKATITNDHASSSSQAQQDGSKNGSGNGSGGGSSGNGGGGGGGGGGVDLFNGMDDIFGTYLDPNYPNLEDFSFVDNMQPFDWSSIT
ncbi:hypothetical protein KC315_g19500, partial [Hortaea werneckii]